MKRSDLTFMFGKQFGRLTVLCEDFGASRRKLICKCRCGKVVSVRKDQLDSKIGSTQSCGCLHKEIVSKLFRKHNMCNKSIYRAWAAIKQRCYNPKCPAFHLYGGRGIKLYRKWHVFQNFHDDIVKTIGLRPSNKHSIDRIENNKGYIPGNIRWSTQKEQMLNVRHNAEITFQGQKIKRQIAALKFGINHDALRSRLRMGWDVYRALTTPTKNRKRH